MDDNLVTYLKLNVLLYSDDTILLAESPKKIKTALNSMYLYCKDWNLKKKHFKDLSGSFLWR